MRNESRAAYGFCRIINRGRNEADGAEALPGLSLCRRRGGLLCGAGARSPAESGAACVCRIERKLGRRRIRDPVNRAWSRPARAARPGFQRARPARRRPIQSGEPRRGREIQGRAAFSNSAASLSRLVTGRSVMPQGLMSAKSRKSVVALNAKPCEVTPRAT